MSTLQVANLHFESTANNRLQYIGSNTVTLTTAGLERLRIDASGNISIDSGYGSVATAYGCRAWINFNGQGVVAIRKGGNISSITDNGVGDYTLNFTTPMVDTNYSINVSTQIDNGNNDTNVATGGVRRISGAMSTTSVRIVTGFITSGAYDCITVCATIIR